jgi:hypothetical protein
MSIFIFSLFDFVVNIYVALGFGLYRALAPVGAAQGNIFNNP